MNFILILLLCGVILCIGGFGIYMVQQGEWQAQQKVIGDNVCAALLNQEPVSYKPVQLDGKTYNYIFTGTSGDRYYQHISVSGKTHMIMKNGKRVTKWKGGAPLPILGKTHHKELKIP